MAQFTEVMRQKIGKTFIVLLNNIRVGECSEDNMKQYQPRKIDLNLDASLIIFGENKPKDECNACKLSQLNHFEFKVEASDLFPDTILIHSRASVSSRSCSATAGLPLCLKFEKGARVMITSNIDLSDPLINGKLGIVFDFGCVNSPLPEVYLKLDDEKAGKNAILKDPYASKNKVVPIQKVVANINTNNISSKTLRRTQFPLTLAWVCTVHKVQGITSQKTAVSFKLVKQRTFSPGQIYVALSRSTSSSKLNIIPDFDSKILRANQVVLEQYEYLRK